MGVMKNLAVKKMLKGTPDSERFPMWIRFPSRKSRVTPKRKDKTDANRPTG